MYRLFSSVYKKTPLIVTFPILISTHCNHNKRFVYISNNNNKNFEFRQLFCLRKTHLMTKPLRETRQVFTEKFFQSFVAIKAFYTKANPNQYDGPQRCIGSGFIAHSSGLVMTTKAVTTNMSSVLVVLSDGRQVMGRVVNEWHDVGLVLIKLDDIQPDWPTVAFSDSKRLPALGTDVFSIGTPRLGYNNSVMRGVVSSHPTGYHRKYFLHSAPVGQSGWGGAVVDSDGAVLGLISMATESTENYCVTVPYLTQYIETVESNLHYVCERRESTVGLVLYWMDDQNRHVFDDYATGIDKELPDVVRGLLVWAVDIDSELNPAEITEMNVITHIDGHEIMSATDFFVAADRLSPVPVTVHRSDGTHSVVNLERTDICWSRQ